MSQKRASKSPAAHPANSSTAQRRPRHRRAPQAAARESPTLVVIEATGGLEMPLAAALALAGVPYAIINPRQLRDFAKACGQLAQTDRLDAQM